jgi:hypothetical protein
MKPVSLSTTFLFLLRLQNAQANCATTFSDACLADLNVTRGEASAKIHDILQTRFETDEFHSYISSSPVCYSKMCFEEVRNFSQACTESGAAVSILRYCEYLENNLNFPGACTISEYAHNFRTERKTVLWDNCSNVLGTYTSPITANYLIWSLKDG